MVGLDEATLRSVWENAHSIYLQTCEEVPPADIIASGSFQRVATVIRGARGPIDDLDILRLITESVTESLRQAG